MLYVYKNPINAGLFVNLQYNLKEKFSVMINFKKFNSIISLTAYFNSDDKCKQAITETRWGVGNEQDAVRPYYCYIIAFIYPNLPVP